MTALFFEGSRTVYLILAIGLVIGLLVFAQTRRREWLVLVAVCLLLGVLYGLLDFVFVTEGEADRQQMQSRVEDMSRAVTARDVERLFAHISPKFVSPQGKSRTLTLEFARQMIRNGMVREIRVGNFEFEQDPRRATGTGKMGFFFKVVGSFGEAPFHAETTWDWNASQGWLLQQVEFRNGIGGPVEPLF